MGQLHPLKVHLRAIQGAQTCLVVTGLVGIIVLLGGWGMGIAPLLRLAPGLSAMAPSTCISLIALSAGFFAAQADGPVFGRMAAWSAAGLAGLISIVDLAVMAFGVATGIDGLVWPGAEVFQTVGMAPATAFCTVLASIALWRFGIRQPGRGDPVFVACATLGLVLTLIALVGYAFDAEALYRVSIFTAMALHTAAAFALVFLAALVLRADIGWAAILFRDTPGGAGARRLLPLVLAVPFLLTLAMLHATEIGLFDPNFRAALLVIAMMAMLGATVLRNAELEDRVHEELRVALDDRALLLREMYHRVKNNLQEIDALLLMQSMHVEDPAAKEVLHAMGGRIRALGHVHGLLVSTQNPSQVSADAYLEDLCASIASSQVDADRDVTITAEAPAAPIGIDLAITLGLLVNELVTNALKHAFPDHGAGRIQVRYEDKAGEGAVLTVADSGAGVGENGGAPSDGGGVGEIIVAGLVDQLDAQMTVDTSQGRVVTIAIPPDTETEAEPHG